MQAKKYLKKFKNYNKANGPRPHCLVIPWTGYAFIRRSYVFQCLWGTVIPVGIMSILNCRGIDSVWVAIYFYDFRVSIGYGERMPVSGIITHAPSFCIHLSPALRPHCLSIYICYLSLQSLLIPSYVKSAAGQQGPAHLLDSWAGLFSYPFVIFSRSRCPLWYLTLCRGIPEAPCLT
jgi:hypothetical protein